MSMEAVMEVITRASVDPAFRARLWSNDHALLAEYDLDPAERAALLSATPERLQSLGVDIRASKWGNSDGHEQDGWLDWYNSQFP